MESSPGTTGKPKKEPGTGRNKPCEQCRARKVRCVYSEGATICERCAAQNVTCVFPSQQPGQYGYNSGASNHGDRKRPADAPNAGAGTGFAGSASKRRAMSIQGSMNGPGLGGSGPPSFAQKHGSTFSPAMNSTGHVELPSTSLLKQTLGLSGSFHSRHVGRTSLLPSILFKSAPKRTRALSVRSVGGGSEDSGNDDNEYFHTIADAATTGYHSETESLHAIEACIAPYGKSLVSLYFRIVHPSFPILHKDVFLEQYARSYTELSPPLLAVVYIQALQWWEFSHDLPHKAQKPDEQRLRQLAQESMYLVLSRPKLSTVQAGLLLAQVHDTAHFPLMAQVLATAHELGLHLDCTDWDVPEWEKGLRKRVAWAVFLQDKCGALMNGRPTYIHSDDWLVQPLTHADFPEGAAAEDQQEGSTEVERGRDIFIRMISLAQLQGDILAAFTTVAAHEAMRTHSTSTIAAVQRSAKSIQNRLKAWYASLPRELSIWNVAARKLSSVAYLHMAYCAVQITLHRAVLGIATQMRGSAVAGEHAFFMACYKAAGSSFVTAAALITDLRPQHLQSFWYFISSYNLALVGSLGCELWAVAPEDDRSLWKKRLEEYRWTLRVNARGADFIDAAVTTLNEMMQLLAEAEAPSSANGDDDDDDGDGDGDGDASSVSRDGDRDALSNTAISTPMNSRMSASEMGDNMHQLLPPYGAAQTQVAGDPHAMAAQAAQSMNFDFSTYDFPLLAASVSDASTPGNGLAVTPGSMYTNLVSSDAAPATFYPPYGDGSGQRAGQGGGNASGLADATRGWSSFA